MMFYVKHCNKFNSLIASLKYQLEARLMPKRPPCAIEFHEQSAFVKWCLIQGIDDFYAIPNGEKRPAYVGAKLEKMGVKPGIPDLKFYIPVYPYHGLYVEMKKIYGSSTSVEQKQKMSRLSELGYLTLIAKGWIEASNIIRAYLDGLYGQDKQPIWVSPRSPSKSSALGF